MCIDLGFHPPTSQRSQKRQNIKTNCSDNCNGEYRCLTLVNNIIEVILVLKILGGIVLSTGKEGVVGEFNFI